MLSPIIFENTDSDSDLSSSSAPSSIQSLLSTDISDFDSSVDSVFDSENETSDSSFGTNMSRSTRSSRSRASAASVPVSEANSNSSGSTVDYEIPQELQEDEDDCIMIVPEVETIDLCTQAPVPLPQHMANQVIYVADSPLNDVRPRRNRRSQSVSIVENAAGPSRARHNRRSGNRVSPYGEPASNLAGPSKISTPKTKKKSRALSFDDSFSQEPGILVNCPICMECVRGRDPVTTLCGHIFCKGCIEGAITSAGKKCPMCRKVLPNKSMFIKLHL